MEEIKAVHAEMSIYPKILYQLTFVRGLGHGKSSARIQSAFGRWTCIFDHLLPELIQTMQTAILRTIPRRLSAVEVFYRCESRPGPSIEIPFVIYSLVKLHIGYGSLKDH